MDNLLPALEEGVAVEQVEFSATWKPWQPEPDLLPALEGLAATFNAVAEGGRMTERGFREFRGALIRVRLVAQERGWWRKSKGRRRHIRRSKAAARRR